MEQFSSTKSFANVLFNKIGIKVEHLSSLENLIEGDAIQARIPYIIELE